MSYQSTAARKRIKRHNEYLRTRNMLVRWIGIIVFGGVGVGLGFLLVKMLMPDHSIFS